MSNNFLSFYKFYFILLYIAISLMYLQKGIVGQPVKQPLRKITGFFKEPILLIIFPKSSSAILCFQHHKWIERFKSVRPLKPKSKLESITFCNPHSLHNPFYILDKFQPFRYRFLRSASGKRKPKYILFQFCR